MSQVMQKIPKGYKQTEIGVIPEDWDIRNVQELLDNREIIYHIDGNHGELYPRSNEFTDFGVPYIAANDFLNGYVNFNQCKKLSSDRALLFKKGIAKNGDVLFAHNATVGPVAILKTNFDYVILSTTATCFRCDNKNLINRYLRYFFESAFFVKQYSAVMSQSTRNQVPITTQRKFHLIIPPTLEQSAIATVLSDTDTLIEHLEKLISKKKAIKQGTMQQLLTGKKRLPGFNGEWEVKKLGEVCGNITTGKLDANAMVENGEYHFYTCAKEYYRINNYAFDTEALLVSGNGANVGYIHYYNGKFNAYQRTYVLFNFSEDIHFIKVFMDRNLQERIRVEVNAGNTPYITMGTLTEMEISIPPTKKEQTAIATILSDMDAEIENLEQKRDKYAMLKQGMMQMLLTGRIRLIDN